MPSWCCTEVPLLSIRTILIPPLTPSLPPRKFQRRTSISVQMLSRKLSTELSTPRLPNFRTSTVPYYYSYLLFTSPPPLHMLWPPPPPQQPFTPFLPPPHPPPPLPIFIAKLQAGLSSSSSSLCTHCWTAGSTKYTVWGFSPLEMRENGYRGVRWNGCKRGLFEKGCSSESMNNKRVFRSTSLQKNGGKSCWIESHKKWKIQNLKEFLRDFLHRTL